MRWGGGRESGNIEDRRGLGPVAGGLGAGGVVLALIGYFVFGIDPSTTLGVVNGAGGQAQQQEGVRGKVSDQDGRFVDVISTSVDDVWSGVFRQEGKTYEPPAAVVIYDQSTGTGCGLGQSAMGPFYCPQDRKVYLDLSFWQELESKFGAGGEAARAYVIAHEIGHHVQNLTGGMDRARGEGAQSGSVRTELQADCYAGVWAGKVAQVTSGQVALDPKDIEDGLRAASAVGDDTLQKRSQGRVMPESFTHGTSAQRMRWFQTGVRASEPSACDTFSAGTL